MQKFKILLLLVVPILFSIGKLQSQNLTDSNLPIILITTDNDPSTGNPYIIPNDPKVSGSIKILRRPDGSRNYLHDQYVPEMWHYNGRIAIETRGQSSQELPKKAYAFHTMSPDDSDKTNASLLGLPSENNWILNGFAFDPSMMRDVISYQLARDMGTYATRTVYCELMINGDYKGLYVLSEKIKIDKDRVNIEKISTDDNEGDVLTGGYIVKADKLSSNEVAAWTVPPESSQWSWINYMLHRPKPDIITESQKQYIKNYFITYQDKISNNNFSTEDGAQYMIDIPSFIDFILLNEYAGNVDSYQFSTFYNKERGGKLKAGPVWDFNLTFGNDIFIWGYDRSKPDIWQHSFKSKYFNDLFYSETFNYYLVNRWEELTQTGMPFHHDYVYNLIDSIADWISEAVEREEERWSTIGDYENHIVEFKSWIEERINWMNGQLIPNSTPLNIDLPPLVISKIHYHPRSEQGFDGNDLEFIEITNNGDEVVDLTGIYISEPGIGFQFEKNTSVDPHQKIYLASNTEVFQRFYGFKPTARFFRNLSNKSYNIVLRDAWGNTINAVNYMDSEPWPILADGYGPHLHLNDINSDNSLAENWVVRDEHLGNAPENPEDVAMQFQIVPNPVSDNAIVHSSQNFDEIRIYNINGYLIFNKKFEPKKHHSFNVGNIKAGVYRLFVLRNGMPLKNESIVII